jgi:hypothetical protein
MRPDQPAIIVSFGVTARLGPVAQAFLPVFFKGWEVAIFFLTQLQEPNYAIFCFLLLSSWLCFAFGFVLADRLRKLDADEKKRTKFPVSSSQVLHSTQLATYKKREVCPVFAPYSAASFRYVRSCCKSCFIAPKTSSFGIVIDVLPLSAPPSGYSKWSCSGPEKCDAASMLKNCGK